ncbi:MAG: tRNA (adenosine(37)-N6)-threonylcarbamoyltransferase complex ATPase subunit type 1 TsaE [Spirochaetaceae bacterium]|jgi:tRNA threonylcarbamoyladenosine biosynthesis protein TsaE|nr:tRNA (adenosine(37)-N6)-threonylcarbamoyltransferase complex ATPase subunit type 1 TsaE [Spirochaetaceae bacterium]
MNWMIPEGFLTETIVISGSPEETSAAGERLAESLKPGSVVALRGKLGAGKTCFTKGIARFLGIEEEVTSPTYTIVSEYDGKIPLYHIDAYRLNGDDDFSALGGEEILSGGGVSVIEWSERIPASIPPAAVIVELEILPEGGRKITTRIPSGCPA